MNKRRWVLIILLAIAAVGYFKLFYKTYSTAAVAKSADGIVALDVKRITNTLIWNWISTPGQWKKTSFSSADKNEISWKDMVVIPDYVLAFHVQHQPAAVWYISLQVKDENDFTKGLAVYHFAKQNSHIYSSSDAGIQFYKSGNKVLVTNAAPEDSNYLSLTAQELFINKQYIARQTLQQVIDAKSHLALYIAANNFLQHEAVVSANFDNTTIELSGTFLPKPQFGFAEASFSYNPHSVCTLNFTQPSAAVYNLLSAADKYPISKALSLNIDSLLLPSNKYYSLDIAALTPRVDSAITYDYDNDFNKIEKVVVNTIEEPAFNFSVTGDSITHMYNYFEHANKIEQSDTGQLFKAIPFVTSYCNLKSAKELNITSKNYEQPAVRQQSNAVLLLTLQVAALPNDLLRYLPDGLVKMISTIQSAQFKVSKENDLLQVNCTIQKKNTASPVINW